jgi:hypothetical protein
LFRKSLKIFHFLNLEIAIKLPLMENYDATRDVEVLSYTEPSGTRFDIEGGNVLRNSSPVKVSFELKRQAAADLHTGPLAP